MKITKILIDKFRGFQNVEFELGSHLTVIAGQNGTQKTTLLGMLTQPFTITDKKNPMYGEKPLSGESFRSQFADKFKLSDKFDKAGSHKWTLFFDDNSEYTAGSIDGYDKTRNIRIWKVHKNTGKADKTKGSGYIQLPVIYLSLKRLLPIGEDKKISENTSLKLSDDEKKYYSTWHNKILILTRDEDKIIDATSLESPQKQTLGANTLYYDWQSNSAGQDNIGKILLAIISFKRLKEKYPEHYKGGVLSIDEIDTTFYPGSQIKLLDALNKFASDFDIQIIFTTHSLTLLEKASKYQKDEYRKHQIRLVYLKKENQKIIIKNNVAYRYIINHLNKTITKQTAENTISVYTEDKEAVIFAKSLLGTNRTKNLNFVNINFSCSFLLELALKKVSSFMFPDSIIILDGDIKKEKKSYNKAKKLKNILILPTNKSPEQIVADFLHNLPAKHSLWENINETFEHETCFIEYSNDEIQGSKEHSTRKKPRAIAKEWFKSHVRLWGRNASKVLNPWKKQNKKLVDEFNKNFDSLFEKF